MKLVLGVSGASGVNLAWCFIENLPHDIELFIVLSAHAKKVALAEMGLHFIKKLKTLKRPYTLYKHHEIDAPIASGSFGIDAMAVIPASLNTFSKIAHGICDDLLTRCASVVLKEQKKLLIAPRELPLHAIALENLLKLAQAGAIIAPPFLTYYTKPKDLESMELFLVGKWFDSLGIGNDLYQRWGL
ncbi:UbiX family flavin prenyltransferase [Helicobacter ailurogastricus]|uniref:3-polyprenyl-4-hydroxybenzoate carboxy-lyase UbiX n=1 Tax=Helicobacter ailurogastricus TaxID=1578720 RepID=A0A0K2Y5P0_9HELI|nr:UbiX family flavin prenyltransferase [Helicobacter ailurogastricus]BDQ29585.1 flavin prenyltransferase UbiX [Helicobacter ailurogastricus]GLH57637.1 3-octaprenyl-4-hydroxybenzoate carboxy-lyase PaaD [Helicobacter ailurogastricus]GLH59751.1 3-octaprenyl-4-hydroxybenzoate carboxy-lyase PaaD [Helicobacter ailurogastricus]CRF52450.1 3-polyprenyl-4-hydroxybenzoate carboxy-lyase UbiX [Helicobacter ailurogastricus]